MFINMSFYYLGKPKGIKDLDLPSLKLTTIDRKQIPILVIDDNEFEYLEHLNNRKYPLNHI